MGKKLCFFLGDVTKSGGTERVAIQLANTLQTDGTYALSILSITEQQEQPFYEIHPAIGRHTLGETWLNPGPGYIPLIGKLKKFLKEQDIDIIIDVDLVLDVLAIPATRRLKTKVVSWEHFNLEFEQSVWYRKMILRYSVKRSDYVVVLTDGDLAEYQARLGRNRAICRIYNPVAYQWEAGAETEKQKLILSVGRLVPEKGIEYIKTVALQILKHNPDWQWMILGEGCERRNLEAFIQTHHLAHQLILKGNVDNVSDYLRQASIFVVTSKYEGLGLGMLEARAMKVPCVSFDVKMGPREVIHHGVDGYLVPAFDCGEMAQRIETLMHDPKQAMQFAEHAFATMDAFALEPIVKQWMDVFESVLEKG